MLLKITHLRRREQINQWEKNGEERMAFTVFDMFPALKEDRFLLLELSLMQKTTAKDLKAGVSLALKKILEKIKVQKYEVCQCSHRK